jgi:hypothetical protein
MTHPPDRTDRPRGFWGSKAGLVAIAFLAIAAFLLVSEHRAHALGYLPFLLLLACPLLHRLMHGGHGSHGAHRGHSGRQSDRAPGEGG